MYFETIANKELSNQQIEYEKVVTQVVIFRYSSTFHKEKLGSQQELFVQVLLWQVLKIRINKLSVIVGSWIINSSVLV